MATQRYTWNTEPVDAFLDMTNWPRTDLGFMKKLFFAQLEHESCTALEMARETEHFAPEIREKLETFKASYLELRKVLLAATKCSEKF